MTEAIKSDLIYLKRKRGSGDLNDRRNRGLILIKTSNGHINLIMDKQWPYLKSIKVFGDNGLMVGQLWRNRVHLMRDGDHEALIAGICGSIKEGA